ncbi:MaoC family dehydratase N-terminal domain-containing protein [Variovorax sp. UMC13]|uniref:FAS1-like dehydratase domain-containing protein n=1 Tax=Variovorax sp. UMC13 TaxID=1862326 RepID=UPI001601D250|nr:MaoC family dehydratase N-terminal domain-containing protein [Variovorax sp. UMC13]MBB1603774.1 acyl-CoA dehydrogenase [Variovorax sp. UMC13]
MHSKDTDMHRLTEWIGRSETHTDVVTAAPVAALSATLDRDDPLPVDGDELPPPWHWLYFLPQTRRRDIGTDGHARRGGFLPPVPLPRRMWAGSQLQFHQPLRIGETVTRVSRIAEVKVRTGRTGTLVFVKVQHELSGAGGLAVTDVHDIVYREAPVPETPAPVPAQASPDPVWVREVVPDEVLLFRYSALTFNGHRIHYDQLYVTQVEGYAGLVVHGPLIATLLLDHLRDRLAAHRPDAVIRSFEFRALSPIVHTERFAACAEPQSDGLGVRLWARKASGVLCMEATATLA